MKTSGGEFFLYENGRHIGKIGTDEDIPDMYSSYIRKKKQKNIIFNILNLGTESEEAVEIVADSETQVINFINLGKGIKDEK